MKKRINYIVCSLVLTGWPGLIFVAMSGTKKKETIVSTTAVPIYLWRLHTCTVYLDICEVYYYMRAVYTYLLLPWEESISIKAPKGPRRETHLIKLWARALAPCLRAISTTHHLSCILFQRKQKTPGDAARERRREEEKKNKTKQKGAKKKYKKIQKKKTTETKNLKSEREIIIIRERALGSDSFKSSISWSGTPAAMDHETSDSKLFSRFPQPPLQPPPFASLFTFFLSISEFRLFLFFGFKEREKFTSQ